MKSQLYVLWHMLRVLFEAIHVATVFVCDDNTNFEFSVFIHNCICLNVLSLYKNCCCIYFIKGKVIPPKWIGITIEKKICRAFLLYDRYSNMTFQNWSQHARPRSFIGSLNHLKHIFYRSCEINDFSFFSIFEWDSHFPFIKKQQEQLNL